MADPPPISSHLLRDPRGFWSAEPGRPVSYPSGGHDVHYALEDTSFWFRHRNQVILAAVRAFPLAAGPVADVGGGNGYVARALEQAGLTVVLIEPGVTGAVNACRRGVRTVICSTAEAAGLSDGSLGGFGLFDVLEHVEDDVGFLAGLGRKLAAGGRAYVTVPAYPALWSSEDTHLGHYRRYTLASLAGAVERAGLSVEYATYFFWPLPPPILILRTLPSRLGLRRAFRAGIFKREHSARGGWLGRIATGLLAGEVKTVERRSRVPFGSSCLIVGRRSPG